MDPAEQAAHDVIDRLGRTHLYTPIGTSVALRLAQRRSLTLMERAELAEAETVLRVAGHLLDPAYQHYAARPDV